MGQMSNCRKCGKMFMITDSSMFCNRCSADEEAKFKLLRDYVYNNPGISVYELSSRLNINVSKITRYIKDGKLDTI